MIKYDETNKIFYLNTQNTTYAFSIYNDILPVHLYWGKRINPTLKEDICDEFIRKNQMACDCGENSSEALPLEFSTYGSADMRIPSFNATYSDGTKISKPLYKDFEIIKGKPQLKGLPATYCECDNEADTLILHLFDKLKNVHIYLSYTVFEELDVITRNVKIVNNGERMVLDTALSTTVDFYAMGDSDIIHLDGAWCRERHITRRPIVYGNQNVESRWGASSQHHNPFMAVCDRNATENIGDVYGFSLVYSGNFTVGVECDSYKCGRAYIGINPFGFDFVLENGEEFQTPEAVLVYSPDGFGGMSRIYHRFYRTRLCRGKYRDKERFIIINNWEATYFNFNEEKIVAIAKKAAEIGVDTMVLDDGWFGKRITDNAGLGDWYENSDRLPNGLQGLAKKINALGMHFGLWLEPEMVNPDSDLFRKHPDWVLHTKGRKNSLTRNQLTLDLSREDVCDYIIDSISVVLGKANIEYVKWDMNRYMSEVGSAFLSADRQGEVMHRYMLGLYRVLDSITSRFPNVLFESCAAGGGRFDPGMLYYTPQIWTSDDSDAEERLMIQYGTSMVYPYSTMSAHVSACPNHQVGRTTPIEMRCNVATVGQFGFELDLNKCTERELKIAKQAVERYKELRSIIHSGDCYRLRSPFETDLSVIEFISKDKDTVIVFIDVKKATPNAPNEYISLAGLDNDAIYVIDDKSYGGDYLMNKGLLFINKREHKSQCLVFKKRNS